MSSWSALSQAHRRRSGAVLQEKTSLNLLTLIVSYYSLPNTRDFLSRRGFIGSCSSLLTELHTRGQADPNCVVASSSSSRCLLYWCCCCWWCIGSSDLQQCYCLEREALVLVAGSKTPAPSFNRSALPNSAYSKICWKRWKASFGHKD